MIPYLEVPPLVLGTWRIWPFTLLVAAAVLSGHFHFLSRARRHGIDLPAAGGMSLCAILCGFIGSHLFKILYNPPMVFRHRFAVVDIFNGMSSFGGLAGGLAGMALYFRFRRWDSRTRVAMVDDAAYVFPFAWIFGRLGCAIAHDHPGVRSGGMLAVAYPHGSRYDLGLLELLFIALVIVPAFVWLDRRQRGAGFYPGLLLAVYGIFRVLLDQLHEAPPRYLGITLDQWGGWACAAAGLWYFRWARGNVTVQPRSTLPDSSRFRS